MPSAGIIRGVKLDLANRLSPHIGLTEEAQRPERDRTMPSLVLYHDYTREEVHGIFAPDVPYTPQSGT